jgi:hypothetical protein
MMASAILSDRIPCDRLALNEPSSYELEGSEQASDSINKKTMAQPINTRTEDTTKPLTVAGFVSVD